MKKMVLILIALASYVGVALIAPVMSEMLADFPQASATQMEYIITITPLTMLGGMFLSAILVKYLRRKLLVVIGLAMVAVFGMLPCMATSVTMILLCRAFLGVGIGIVVPLQATYFAEYDEGTRSKLFGTNSVVNGLLSAVFLAAIGILHLSWRDTFLLYSAFLPIMLLCILYLPKGEVLRGETMGQDKQQGSIFSGQFLYFCVVALLMMACYLGIHAAISLYIVEKGIGTAAEASFITTVGTLATVAAGLGYAFLHQKCGRLLAPVFLGSMAGGIALYALGNSVAMLSFGFAILLASQTLVATEFSMNMTQILPLEKVALGSTVLTSCIFAGQFIAPGFKVFLQHIFHLPTTTGCYLALAVVMAVLTVISCIAVKIFKV